MSEKIKVLLITGIVTSEHDPKMNPMIRYLLESTGRFSVKITEEFKGCTAETLEGYDLVFINYDGKEDVTTPFVSWGKTAEKAVYDFVANGGGAVVYHSSMFNPQNWEFPDEFRKLVGFDYNFEKGLRKNPKLEVIVRPVKGSHPIVDGCAKRWMTVQEDFFVGAKQVDPDVTVLATINDSIEDYDPELTQVHVRAEYEGVDIASLPGLGADVPVIWVHNYGKGRVMGISMGHGPDTLRRPNFCGIVTRGCEWCATGEITVGYPNLDGWKRLNAWPYYNDITWQEYAKLTAF